MLVENIRLAFSSLLASKSRAFLTMLGIIIGIASVIAIMTVGNSLTLSVSSSMQSMGANNITVSLKERETEAEEREDGISFGTVEKHRDMVDSDYFSDDLIQEMTEHFSGEIEAVSVEEAVADAVVKNGKNSADVSITGISRGYFTANDITLTKGSKFRADESATGKNVAVVSDRFVEDIGWQENEILGKEFSCEVKGQEVSYTVVGVYEYEETAFGNPDKTDCYIPLSTAKACNHSNGYSTFSVVGKVGVDSDNLAGRIETYLGGYYRSNEYYEVNAYSMSSMVSIMSDMLGTITTAISVIAGIALLVGGIGVMNIMMVSITERTREIGTRKALGAANGDIRTQFIIEAMIICLIGGVIGVIAGVALGMFGASLLGYSASPSVGSIILALTFSMAIGLFFGYHPANKAAKMNPIDALRYE